MFNVLLVDDEPIVKIALRTMIAWDDLGFPICGTASDGVEALALVETLQPDIIITDLKMPNMDGLQLIKELNKLNYNGKIIVASNFGDYELVREALLLGAVDYMLKISIKTEDLISQLQKTASLLQEQQHTLQEQEAREQFMRSNLKSVKGSVLKEYFTDTSLDLIHFLQSKPIVLNLADTPSYLFYITFDRDISAAHSGKTDISVAFIENMILDLVETANDIEVFQVEVNGIIALISEQQLKSRQIEPIDFINKIRTLIRMYISIEPTIVYSHEVIGYVEARDTYCACKDALNINFYDHRPVIYVNEVKFKEDSMVTNYVDYSKSMIKHWQKHDKDSVKDMLKAFFQECRHHYIHPDVVKSFIIKCLDYIPLYENKIQIDDPEQYEYRKKSLLYCKNIESFSVNCIQAFQYFSLLTDVPAAPVFKKEVLDVIHYIEVHYQDKITLEMISSYTNFSENYLCRMFKEQVGTSLFSYINTVRMNKAAELIMKGCSYIKEVASLVGISDQFYFNRLFKRHFGMSPTEYKAQQLQTD
ncbi:response regulator transcription factor [Paenibacillus sp. FA6]|uniref:response regulator transcription factor n=1 Tax=Paenibacillus sp. FA6 TaxID=3413029 RepID=UPI003F65956E